MRPRQIRFRTMDCFADGPAVVAATTTVIAWLVVALVRCVDPDLMSQSVRHANGSSVMTQRHTMLLVDVSINDVSGQERNRLFDKGVWS
jgi:hypothetical protein